MPLLGDLLIVGAVERCLKIKAKSFVVIVRVR